ncbi:MAG: alpha-amylase family protein [Candidatus Berkiellales bacterium]
MNPTQDQITPHPFMLNGMMRCYNFFPTQFGSITEMKEYLKAIADMGFNACWINPIQLSGDVKEMFRPDKSNGVSDGNEVTHSIYAMKGSKEFSPFFKVDEKSLQEFTTCCWELGIVPLFDLVLNHVSLDAPIIEEKKERNWFKSSTGSFPDTLPFNYENDDARQAILKEFWEPYIKRYIEDYGFGGVRVDAVRHLRPDVRQAVYNYIDELTRKNHKVPAVILDEALFDDKKNLGQFVKKKLLLQETGPTHITNGVYYAVREKNGGLEDWVKVQEGLKAQVVFTRKDGSVREGAKGGCINFSGNHDHTSLAMQVLLDIAYENLDPDLKQQLVLLKKIEENDKRKDDSVTHVFLFSYVQELEKKIEAKDSNVIEEVKKRLREKIALAALHGSGGWYMLSGDEYGDLLAKSVFRRANAPTQDFYAQRVFWLFSAQNKEKDIAKVAEEVLKEMAKENIQKDAEPNQYDKKAIKETYHRLAGKQEQQTRLLAAYIENLRHQINAGDSKTFEVFAQRMSLAGSPVGSNEEAYERKARDRLNRWGSHFDLTAYITRINTILAELPTSKFGFWSEVIRLGSNPDLVIVVRRNAMGFESPTETDLVIVNLKEDLVELTEKDIEQIAIEFQKRTDPLHFKAANECVMSCLKTGQIQHDETITLPIWQHSPKDHENDFLMFPRQDNKKPADRKEPKRTARNPNPQNNRQSSFTPHFDEKREVNEITSMMQQCTLTPPGTQNEKRKIAEITNMMEQVTFTPPGTQNDVKSDFVNFLMRKKNKNV